jgi:hypothetical protein
VTETSSASPPQVPRGNRDQPASSSVQEHQKRGDEGRRAILQPARRAAADQVHDEPEIEAARMNQQALEDIGVAAQMRAAHPPGVVELREGAFDQLASLTHQARAARATNPPPIGIHRGLGRGRPRPIAATTVRLRDVRPKAYGRQLDHNLIAVMSGRKRAR